MRVIIDNLKLYGYGNARAVILLYTIAIGGRHMEQSVFVTRCAQYAEQHWDECLYMDKVAKDMNCSVSYIEKVFIKEKGITFKQYFTEIKMDRAYMLLLDGNSVTEVAAKLDYSISGFWKVFKRKYNIAPSKIKDNRR